MENRITTFGERYLEAMKEYAALERKIKELENDRKEARKRIQEAMEANNVRSFENDILKLTLVAPSVTTTIDTSALRIECPDIYDDLIEKYPKTTERRQGLRVTLR